MNQYIRTNKRKDKSFTCNELIYEYIRIKNRKEKSLLAMNESLYKNIKEQINI